MSQLDDILNKDFDCMTSGFKTHQLSDADASYTKQQIKQLFLELIGKNDKVDGSDSYSYDLRQARNELRRDLRQIVELQ